MKTQQTNTGTWLCTGDYSGHKFVVEESTRREAMAAGYEMADAIFMRLLKQELPAIFREQAE